jgi:hypothetical protein
LQEYGILADEMGRIEAEQLRHGAADSPPVVQKREYHADAATPPDRPQGRFVQFRHAERELEPTQAEVGIGGRARGIDRAGVDPPVDEPLAVNGAKSLRQPPQVPPEDHALPRTVQRAKPVVGLDEARRILERREIARYDDVESVVGFTRVEDFDDDVISAREGPNALVLPHLVSPDFPQIGIDGRVGLLPVLDDHGFARSAV